MEILQSVNPFESIDSQLRSIRSELADIRNALATQPQQERRYYSIAEAAKKFNVSAITVYRNANAGKIPTKKIGSRVVIPGSFLDR